MSLAAHAATVAAYITRCGASWPLPPWLRSVHGDASCVAYLNCVRLSHHGSDFSNTPSAPGSHVALLGWPRTPHMLCQLPFQPTRVMNDSSCDQPRSLGLILTCGLALSPTLSSRIDCWLLCVLETLCPRGYQPLSVGSATDRCLELGKDNCFSLRSGFSSESSTHLCTSLTPMRPGTERRFAMHTLAPS